MSGTDILVTDVPCPSRSRSWSDWPIYTIDIICALPIDYTLLGVRETHRAVGSNLPDGKRESSA
jgi:hypothetical protein